MKPKVYVTRLIPEPGLNMLREHFEVEVNLEDRVLTKEELIEKVKGKDGILCLLTDAIDTEVLDVASNAKIFANYAVGFNNIDVEAATAHNVLVSNTPGVLTDTTADFAWALLFAAARRVVSGDRYTREGRFKGWGPMLLLGQDITGKTLGLAGAGRIGQAMAKKAKGFEMNIIYFDARRNPQFEEETGAVFVDKQTLFQQADFISLHVPLLPETKHFVGEKELKSMKKTAILINTARGPIVDEMALVKALKDGEIFAAGLDVFEWEPELAPGLKELDNVILAPHIASASIETRTEMAIMAAENIIAALSGRRPENCINWREEL